MGGNNASATAMLVGTHDMGERPQTATVLVAREEIEEVLASDESPELVLEVQLGGAEQRNLHVGWERSDLESVLSRTGPGGITFSFEPMEIYRALEPPNADFEGHGFREAVLLTVAAASASAAVAVSTATGGVVEGTGVGGAATPAVVAPGHGEAGTASTLASGTVANDEAGAAARGIGVTIPGADETTLAARGITPAPAVHDEATLVDRGLQTAPVAVDSGTSLDLPNVDAGTAAVIGGLAGASLLIIGGTFVARRRIDPA
jgi:hypothetical protein